jgi:hypothetical protein
MLFSRISPDNNNPAPKGGSPTDVDGKPRYPISPLFQATATLNTEAGRVFRQSDNVAPQAGTLKCCLLDCSEQEVRVRLDPKSKIPAGELRRLRLTVPEFNLSIPCSIASMNEQGGGVVLGLRLEFAREAVIEAYWQLFEIVVLSSCLTLQAKSVKPDESGYLVEHYVCSRPARLSIWRHPSNQIIMAFEFRLKRQVARAVVGKRLECKLVPEAGLVHPAMKVEIQRLFSRVASNLSPAMPGDVREVLQKYIVPPDEPQNRTR